MDCDKAVDLIQRYEEEIANNPSKLLQDTFTFLEQSLEDELRKQFHNEIIEWDWSYYYDEALKNISDRCGYHYLGSVISLMPTGKYGNDDIRDNTFWSELEKIAENNGGFVECGSNGDGCDIFFVVPILS